MNKILPLTMASLLLLLAGACSGGGDSDADADTGGAECVLTGDEGLAEGDLAPDITLYNCDGEPVQLHQLICESPYTIVYSFAEW